ncbi:GNAT family N-acetyltransferase [Haloparvum sp. PAK95]|uniref:GNAT family N-acetyltransferase n=1 Tax=Haloparvum sp. PAK95 TaxID=3418962 RepID=UPI003D2F0F4C
MPGTDVEIREATSDDAERLAGVYRSAYAHNRKIGFPASAESATRSEVVEWITAHTVFVAVAESAVVGGVRLTEPEPARGKISRFGVHEDWKGRGIGGELLAHVEEVCRNRGYDSVRLTTPGDHPFLPGFYRSRGYEKTGDYPLDYRDYDEIVMAKQL